MKNSYSNMRKLWAMRTMSVARGNPTGAKAIVLGITIANAAVGIWATKRLKDRGSHKTAKFIHMLNSISLGVNAVDTYEICKEIDKLSGKNEKQPVMKTDSGEFKLPTSGIIVALRTPNSRQATKDLPSDSDVLMALKGIFGENIGCTDGTCDMCKAFEKAGLDTNEDQVNSGGVEHTSSEVEMKKS